MNPHMNLLRVKTPSLDVSEAETSPEGVYVLIKTEGSKYVSTRVLSKADGPSLKREIEWVKERCLNGKR